MLFLNSVGLQPLDSSLELLSLLTLFLFFQPFLFTLADAGNHSRLSQHIDSALLRGPADGTEKQSILTDILIFSGNRRFLFPKAFQHGTDYMTGTSIFTFHRLSPSL